MKYDEIYAYIQLFRFNGIYYIQMRLRVRKMIPDSLWLSGIIAYMAVGERGANADPVPAAGQIRFPLAIPIRVPRTILFLFQLPVTIRFSPPVAVRFSGSVAVRLSAPGRAAG